MHDAGWPTVSADEQDEIDRIVAAGRESLAAAGFASRDPKFPFVMHHERYRVRLRSKGLRPRHAHVALLLALWAREREEGFAKAYAWQAISGAVDRLRQPGGADVPEAVRAMIDAVGHGPAFEPWARSNIGLLPDLNPAA